MTDRLSLQDAVVEAARELDLCEDLGEPIGPGQDPLDWDAYNAVRRKLYDALARLDAFDKEQEIVRRGLPMAEIKVGMRLRHLPYITSSEPEITVTEITERGFKYKFDTPWHLGARIGTATEGEHYGHGAFSLYELAPTAPKEGDGHG